MRILKEKEDLSRFVESEKKQQKKIGFVPTMGALHEGHISLVHKSIEDGNFTVVSIFVNPTQFNNPLDFKRYPITVEEDILKLEEAGVDLLFLPNVKEMYPNGTSETCTIELGHIENVLEGFYRPGHFQGVANIVKRLLEAVNADVLYLGQKDYQQCMVIGELVGQYELPVQIEIAPTKRESNGLAMSSRNLLLSEEAKTRASAIFNALTYVKENIRKESIRDLKEIASTMILKAGFSKIDYFEICEASDLSPVDQYSPEIKMIVLTAAVIEDVRLIDNMIIN